MIPRLEIDREGGARELGEVEQRAATLESERATLADAAELVARDVSTADEAVEVAKSAVEQAEAALSQARDAMNAAKESEAAARHELFRADETFTALQGKVHALESLERADREAFTREPPKTLKGQISYLIRQLGSAKAVATPIVLSRMSSGSKVR